MAHHDEDEQASCEPDCEEHTVNCEQCGEVISTHETEPEARKEADHLSSEDGNVLCDGCSEDDESEHEDETPQSEEELEEALLGFFRELRCASEIGECCDACIDLPAPQSVETFDEGGVLTKNRGLVLRYGGGVEYQVTIVRSK